MYTYTCTGKPGPTFFYSDIGMRDQIEQGSKEPTGFPARNSLYWILAETMLDSYTVISRDVIPPLSPNHHTTYNHSFKAQQKNDAQYKYTRYLYKPS